MCNCRKGGFKSLEGDCETAVGVFAEIENQEINLDAELFSIDGSKIYNTKKSKPLEFAKDLGNEVGKILKKRSNNSYKK